jgi:cytochrome c peroxidase
MWFKHLRTLIVLVIGLLACSICQNIQADEPVTPVHLVGHEDAALLDRVQDLIDDWDPRKLTNPVVETTQVQQADGTFRNRKQLKRSDLAEFIADVEAAEVLGKAFFWEMQAGSDFRRLPDETSSTGVVEPKYVGTACASCHYRNGADARSRHSTRIPQVVWKKYPLHPDHNPKPLPHGERQLDYDVRHVATSEVRFDDPQFGNLSLIIGSAGVEPKRFLSLNKGPLQPGDVSEKSSGRSLAGYGSCLPHWSMFVENQVENGKRFRQITERNSPSVINSGFADRLFHDGRAESTFNGISIFGDRDQNPVLFRGVPQRDLQGRIIVKDGIPVYGKPVSVHVALTKAALASQAVGPIVNEVEMSYLGRSFPNLACKLLDTNILFSQKVDPNDSLLGPWCDRIGRDATSPLTYRQLIKQAFRREWWDSGTDMDGTTNTVPLVLMGDRLEDRAARGEIVVANFSLYWGLSVMLYESSLVSNQSPFDGMMQGNAVLVEERWEKEKSRLGTIRLDRVSKNGVLAPAHKTGSAVFQHGFRVFLNRGCIECHSGPLFSEIYDRKPEAEPFAIYEQLTNMLLPNSRSDAIALRRSEFHRDTLSSVSRILSETPLSLPEKIASRIARELDLLREQAQGDLGSLERLVDTQLSPMGGGDKVKRIAGLLMAFEKRAPLSYGRRLFFSEDERVDMAGLLVEPAFVEAMPIPPNQVRHRPQLPIQSPRATTDYAFYDLGFYALGLSPARYDRGIGGRSDVGPTTEEISQVLGEIIELAEDARDSNAVDEAVPNSKQITKSRAPAILESAQKLKQSIDSMRATERSEEKIELEFPKEIAEQIQQFVGSSQAASGSSGSAYRLRTQYRSLEQYKLMETGDGVGKRQLTPGEESVIKPRACEDGPAEFVDLEFDTKTLCAREDMSWNREDIPQNVRRSNLVFKSRARTLVTDEEPWGYRKPLLHDNELSFWGAFKTPSLRNVELTAPYMHNGRLENLRDLIEFYDDGGFIQLDRELYPDKHPEITPLDMTGSDRKALEFFLICLTDERVRLEQGPFDHPSLQLVHGYDDIGNERVFEVPSIGKSGWKNPGQIPSLFPEHN